MGGATSKQPAAVQPVVIRGEPPSRNTTIEGLSISTSEGCRDCRLVFPQGSSAASVRMYREFGAIQKSECDRYKQDVIRVRSGQLAWDEFKSNLSRGLYYEERTPGFCSQLMADTTELGKVATLEALPSVVRYPRIRKIAEDGGFSAETKLFLLPNIPFQFSFNGQTITVSKLALYHPCPLRVENSQYDAVLSLNDPGDATRPAVILMIPIKGDVSPGISGTFFERIASAIPGILQPSQPTGQYDPIDVPTGSNWNLSLLLSGRGTSGGTAVNTGYFVWSALPDMEEYLEVDTAYLKRYAWRPRSNAGPTYIMLKDPVLISPYDLQTLTLLPVTPAERAIHAPLATSVVYNASQTGSDVVGCSTSRESFTDQTSPQCDPFALLPQKAQFTGATLMQTLLGLIIPIVIVIVVFWAVKAASGPGGEAVMRWAEGAGRWVAGVREAGAGISAAAGTGVAAVGRAAGTVGRVAGTGFIKAAEAIALRGTRRRRKKIPARPLTSRTPVAISARNPLREYRSSEALSRGRRLVPAPPAKRTFSKGNKVIINKAKHPKGYVTRGGKKQKGGARDQCLGTPKYKQVGEIVDVKLEDPQGLTVLVKCTSPTGETTVDWYDPDDLLPYEGPDGDVVVTGPGAAGTGLLDQKPAAATDRARSARAAAEAATRAAEAAQAKAAANATPEAEKEASIAAAKAADAKAIAEAEETAPPSNFTTIEDINADILKKYPTSGGGPVILEKDRYGIGYSDDQYESINTSTHNFDCLVHSFLIGVSPNFRRLSEEDKNVYANWFRRVEMPEHYTQAQRESARPDSTILLWKQVRYLDDRHVSMLASTFNTNILVVSSYEKIMVASIISPGIGNNDFPFIFIYNPGDGHFRALRSKDGKEFTFSRAQANAFKDRVNNRAVSEVIRRASELRSSNVESYRTLIGLLNLQEDQDGNIKPPAPGRVVKKRVIAPEPPDEEPGAGTGLSALDEEVEREFNLLGPPPSIRSAKARSDERKARIAKERAAAAAAKPPAARIPTPAPALSPVTRGLSDYRSPLARRSATASASVPPSRPAAPAVPPHKRGLSTTAINLPAAPIRALEPYKSSRAADLAKLRIAAAKPIGRLTDLQRSQALIQQANRDRDVKEQEAKKFVDTLDLPKPPQFGRGRKRRQTHRYA